MGTVKHEKEKSIFHALMRQHRTIEAMFARIEAECERGPDQAAMLLATLRADLLAHGKAEEALVYPRFRRISGLGGEVAQAFEEHAIVEQRLAELAAIDPSEDEFLDRVLELGQMVRGHVADEEGELFRIAKIELSPEESERLADEFLAEYERLGGAGDEAQVAWAGHGINPMEAPDAAPRR